MANEASANFHQHYFKLSYSKNRGTICPLIDIELLELLLYQSIYKKILKK